VIRNLGARLESLHLRDAYSGERTVHRVEAGETLTRRYL
jgi:hypothetical protein